MKALKKYYFHYVFLQPITSSAIQITDKYVNINNIYLGEINFFQDIKVAVLGYNVTRTGSNSTIHKLIIIHILRDKGKLIIHIYHTDINPIQYSRNNILS